MKRFLATFLFCTTAFAQDAPKPNHHPDTPVVAPTISVELKALFFKAQAEYMGARNELEATPQWKKVQEKQDSAQKISENIASVCGTKFHAQLDKDGDPVCILNTEPPKSEIKSPEPAKK